MPFNETHLLPFKKKLTERIEKEKVKENNTKYSQAYCFNSSFLNIRNIIRSKQPRFPNNLKHVKQPDLVPIQHNCMTPIEKKMQKESDTKAQLIQKVGRT